MSGLILNMNAKTIIQIGHLLHDGAVAGRHSGLLIVKEVTFDLSFHRIE